MKMLHWLGSLILVILVTSPLSAEDFDAQAVVEMAYKEFSLAAAGSGEPVKITLENFEEFVNGTFDSLLWKTYVRAAPRNLRIMVTDLNRYQDDTVVDQGVAVDLEWKSRESPGRLYDAVGAMTVAEVFDTMIVLKEFPALPVKLLAFDVSVTFEKETINYKAAAFVFSHQGHEWVQLHDRRLLNLDLAIEKILKRSVRHPDEFFGPSASFVKNIESTQQSCWSWQKNHFGAMQKNGPLSTGHVWGGHSAKYRQYSQCFSTFNCVSDCKPSFVNFTCDDTGLVYPTILPTTAIVPTEHLAEPDTSISVIAGNTTKGAECGTATACGFRKCPLSICNGSVIITFSGLGLGLKALVGGSGVIANLSMRYGTVCPPAAPKAPVQCPTPGESSKSGKEIVGCGPIQPGQGTPGSPGAFPFNPANTCNWICTETIMPGGGTATYSLCALQC